MWTCHSVLVARWKWYHALLFIETECMVIQRWVNPYRQYYNSKSSYFIQEISHFRETMTAYGHSSADIYVARLSKQKDTTTCATFCDLIVLRLCTEELLNLNRWVEIHLFFRVRQEIETCSFSLRFMRIIPETGFHLLTSVTANRLAA